MMIMNKGPQAAKDQREISSDYLRALAIPDKPDQAKYAVHE